MRADLQHARAPEAAPLVPLPERPLRIFVSCAEASGEAHAVELVEALRSVAAERGAPAPEFVGLGGARLAAAGVRIVGDPVARAVMGTDVLRSLSFFQGLLADAAACLRTERFDCVLPVDSPALHVPLAHIAKRYGLPVVHYVTPQYWAWAPWRVRGYRRAVDLALTILPFEPAWFERHGVRTAHVGHPQADLLSGVPTGAAADARSLVLLPGSRLSVIRRNLPWMLEVVRRVRLAVPELEVVLPHSHTEFRSEFEAIVAATPAAGAVRIVAGDLHAELAHARTALSVSGTVLLDLLHHRIPTAVVYRIESRWIARFQDTLLTVPWFSSVNLLAGKDVLPEFAFAESDESAAGRVADEVIRLHTDDRVRAEVKRELDAAAERLGEPGAALRAAGHVLAYASECSSEARA